MIRNLKALGIAFVAIFAMGAVVASTASAQTQGKLTSTGPVTLDIQERGEKENYLEYPGIGGKTECPGHLLTGHKTLTSAETAEGKKHELIPVNSTSATITTHYEAGEGCHAIDGEGKTHKATVTMNGCDYDLKIGNTVAADEYAVLVDVVCPSGKVIEVHIYPFAGSEFGGSVCTITVGPQTNRTGATVKTDTAANPHDLIFSGTIHSIHAEAHNSGGCSGIETTTNSATLTANYTVKGTNAAQEPTAITVTD